MTFETKERTYAIVRLIVGAIGIILGMYGVTIDQEVWATFIMEAFCLGAALVAWFWKDNNLTHDRIQKEKFMDAMEEENSVEFEVEEGETEEE